MEIQQIKRFIINSNYRLTSHAEVEREADLITVKEIEEALLSAEADIIEDYPNDPRGPSCLVLGLTKRDRPIHVVCGASDQETLILITVYKPDPEEWINWSKRKEKSS